MLTKTNYSEWVSPTVYVKKKNDKIRACAGFSIGFNDCLVTYNYSLSSSENIFVKLSSCKVFSKLDLFKSIPLNTCQQTKMCEVFNYKDIKRSAYIQQIAIGN